MVGAFLRFVLLALVGFFAFLVLRIVLGLKRLGTQALPKTPREVQGVMVKDEICGTYVPRDEALREVRDGVEHFFCSEECRRKLESR